MKTEKNILIAFILNLFFSLFEFIGGLITNSVAIISDSIHDMGDAISIGISFFLEKKSKHKPNDKYTYGYLRYSVLGGLITTVILLVGSILVIYSSIKRIINPVSIHYHKMVFIALFGVVVNFMAAYVTHEGKSINQRSVHLHLLEDVLGWIIVLIGAIFMLFTDIKMIDPLMSIGVAIFILVHAFKNLFEILDLFLEKTPNNISIDQIKKKILTIEEVISIHHIHVWSIDGVSNYATLHVVVDKPSKKIKQEIRKQLKDLITHVTIELETKDEKCDEIDCLVHH